jgi:hypothetical protein
MEWGSSSRRTLLSPESLKDCDSGLACFWGSCPAFRRNRNRLKAELRTNIFPHRQGLTRGGTNSSRLAGVRTNESIRRASNADELRVVGGFRGTPLRFPPGGEPRPSRPARRLACTDTRFPQGSEEREMRFSTLAILFATAGLLGSGTAFGQYRSTGVARRPVVQRSAHTSERYYQPLPDESSPSDAPAPPVANGYANVRRVAKPRPVARPSPIAAPSRAADVTTAAATAMAAVAAAAIGATWASPGSSSTTAA